MKLRYLPTIIREGKEHIVGIYYTSAEAIEALSEATKYNDPSIEKAFIRKLYCLYFRGV